MAKVTGTDAFEADEINMHIENLMAAWGEIVIECDSDTCLVSNKNAYDRNILEFREYTAPTILEALRKAVAGD